jgi:signal transduction histidine kinase
VRRSDSIFYCHIACGSLPELHKIGNLDENAAFHLVINAFSHDNYDTNNLLRRDVGPMGTTGKLNNKRRIKLQLNIIKETVLHSLGPAISTNANQIQQVLTNLITNAWETVGEEGGTIHLKVKTVPQMEIPAVYSFPLDWQPQDHTYACLKVTDTGCGIAGKDTRKNSKVLPDRPLTLRRRCGKIIASRLGPWG